MNPKRRPSPNCGARRGGAQPDIVVLHYTAMNDAQAALDRLCDPQAEVSAHYLIARDGELFQLVDESMRAWHAGVGAWGTVQDVNSRSIGIELDNTGFQPFPDPQMSALQELLWDIRSRWQIPPERVIAHSDMAPARKSDPGARFDWRRLALCNLSIWPETEHEPEQAADSAVFGRLMRAIGYQPDLGKDALLAAFRLRFRPGYVGPLDGRDMQIAGNLARRFPVDLPAQSA